MAKGSKETRRAEESKKWKVKQCCRGHDLTVPYICFSHLRIIGGADAGVMGELQKYLNWQAEDDDNQLRADAYLLCLDCAFELLALMEKWRQSTLSPLEGKLEAD
jgi:hypothetical protein